MPSSSEAVATSARSSPRAGAARRAGADRPRGCRGAPRPARRRAVRRAGARCARPGGACSRTRASCGAVRPVAAISVEDLAPLLASRPPPRARCPAPRSRDRARAGGRRRRSRSARCRRAGCASGRRPDEQPRDPSRSAAGSPRGRSAPAGARTAPRAARARARGASRACRARWRGSRRRSPCVHAAQRLAAALRGEQQVERLGRRDQDVRRALQHRCARRDAGVSPLRTSARISGSSRAALARRSR